MIMPKHTKFHLLIITFIAACIFFTRKHQDGPALSDVRRVYINPPNTRPTGYFDGRAVVASATNLIRAIASRTSPAAAVSAIRVDLDDLYDGDFVIDRSPPFIPSKRIASLVNNNVCIEGQIWFKQFEGRIVLTRPHPRILAPLCLIVCNATNHPPDRTTIFGKACGVLRIRPQFDAAGRLESVYCLDDVTFEENNQAVK